MSSGFCQDIAPCWPYIFTESDWDTQPKEREHCTPNLLVQSLLKQLCTFLLLFSNSRFARGGLGHHGDQFLTRK